MSKPSLIQIGNRIVNLDAVRYMEIDGPNIVNVYLPDDVTLQFIKADAHALLAVLNDGYVRKIECREQGSKFEELVTALDESGDQHSGPA
jgi:hypothetical protein